MTPKPKFPYNAVVGGYSPSLTNQIITLYLVSNSLGKIPVTPDRLAVFHGNSAHVL
jgi:hypothetical protein